jgi:peroxiredoxin
MKKLIGLFSLLAVVAGFIFLPKFTSLNTASSLALNVGDTAPDFKLKNVDGRMVSLADYENVKGYIVVFTCNTCPYAVMYEDRLIELHNANAPKGWPVIAIQPNNTEAKPGDNYEEMKIRAKEKDFPFVYLLDADQSIYPQYGATRTPHIFLLDNTRKVHYIGAIDNNPQDGDAATRHYVKEAIAAIEAGKEPDPNFTKAIGCGIKGK